MPVRYTTGLEQTRIVVGLGNPDSEYTRHRHNIGYRCLEEFLRSSDQEGRWSNKKALKCQVATLNLAGCRMILVKPQTFMNHSGEAVEAVLQFYKASVSALWVIHDDVDVDFGVIKTKLGGGSSGHNGLSSITKVVGRDFYRIRVGIGPKRPSNIDLSGFVLKNFSQKEQPNLPVILTEVGSILGEASAGDLARRTYQCL